MTFSYEETPINSEFLESFTLTEEIINEYKTIIGYENSDYVPHSVFASYKFWNSTLGTPPIGTIHLKQKMENYKSPKIDDNFDVKIIIKDKYKKKNRDYLVFETIFSKDCTVYCKETTTYLWGYVKGD